MAGTLATTLLTGAAPTLGTSIQPLTYASKSGTFTTLNLNQGDGNSFLPVYAGTALNLWTVPTGTTIFWTNTVGGSWTTASNWDTGVVPGSSDTVYIGLSGSTFNVTLSGSSTTIAGLQADEVLILGGISSGSAGNITIKNNLVVNNTLYLNFSSVLTFSAAANSTQQITTTSSGHIWDTNSYGYIQMATASHTVTVGHGVLIDGAITIGNSTTGTWLNYGTMEADSAQYPLAFDGTSGNIYTNESGGVWETFGGTFNLAGSWSNLGEFIVNANNNAPYGVLNLGGTFTAAGIGMGSSTTFNRATGSNAGVVNITGTLNDNNATLAFTSITGSFNLASGGVLDASGGTISSSSGNTLDFTGSDTLAAGSGANRVILSGSFLGSSSTTTLTGDWNWTAR